MAGPGAVDTEKMIERADREMKAAGIEKVVAEKQRQLERFLEM